MEKSKLIVVTSGFINAFFKEQQRGTKQKIKQKKAKRGKQRDRSRKYSFLVGNHRLERAQRWEYIPTVSSEVGEI